MADCKKYNGSTWEHSLRKLTTATDTITTLPANIYADGNTATIGISGNTVQSGTPTPENPIMPEGTGERTGNLLYKCIENASISSAGKIVENSSFKIYLAKIEQGETYSLVNNYFAFYTSEPEYDLVSYQGVRYVDSIFTAPIDGYVAVRYRTEDTNAMLNSGSTALPYEPYGYKIPISSGGVTTNIYLGSTQTVRQIKKLVLTGAEYWVYQANVTRFVMTINDIVVSGLRATPFYCTHYIPISDGRPIEDVPFDASYLAEAATNTATLNIKIDTYTTAADFKAYLAAQYANGTPVTVWYILSTAETATVNEPIRKIGGYADTVSGITVPTITGKDTFDVKTTLKPSEVTVNYKGWHTGAVHERENGAWT